MFYARSDTEYGRGVRGTETDTGIIRSTKTISTASDSVYFLVKTKNVMLFCHSKKYSLHFARWVPKLGKIAEELARGTSTQRQPADGKLLVEGKATAPVTKGRWRRRHRSSKDGGTVQFCTGASGIYPIRFVL